MSKFWWQVAGFFLAVLLTVTQLRPVLGVEWYGKSEWYVAQANPQSVANYPCDSFSVNAAGKIPPDVPKTEEEKKQFDLANPPNPGLITYNYLYRSGDVPDAPRLARVYGVKPEDWNEHRTPGFMENGRKVYLRWFRNRYSVVDYEYKFVTDCSQARGSRAECIAKAFKWKSGIGKHKSTLDLQKNAIQRLLDAMSKAGITNAQEQAYILATADWESSGFALLYELGKKGIDAYTYFENQYGVGSRKGKRLGNTQSGDGYNFRGHGYVQVTGRANYEGWSNRLDQDFVHTPDLMADPDNAAQIAVEGMKDGTFTGQKLDDFYNDDGTYDYEGARVIINGTDHATDIANRAIKIEKAIKDCNS